MSQKSRRARQEAALIQGQRVHKTRKLVITVIAILLLLSLSGVMLASFNVLPASGMHAMLAPAPVPTPTPRPMTLAKEYVYAGSKLVATEDIASTPSTPHYPTDLAVWRVSSSGSGTWYVLRGDGTTLSQNWGTTGDIPAMGDYDADQKTDFCVFRPSTGSWYMLYSSDGSFHSETWGQNGDTPAPADYDGDGKTDIAVFRSSDNSWQVMKSSGGTISQQFGSSGDVPVPSDYDGDHKADLAVWRSSNSSWYYVQSTNGSIGGQAWGQSTDKPVPGEDVCRRLVPRDYSKRRMRAAGNHSGGKT